MLYQHVYLLSGYLRVAVFGKFHHVQACKNIAVGIIGFIRFRL